MHSLADSIRLWISRSSRSILYASSFQQLLKFPSNIFSPIIVYTSCWPRIPTQPMILKYLLYMIRRLAFNAHKFHKVNNRINASQSVEFNDMIADIDCPLTNQTNVFLLPGHHSHLSWRQFPISCSLQFVSLTYCAFVCIYYTLQQWMIERLSN
jgi:hypothetical protein